MSLDNPVHPATLAPRARQLADSPAMIRRFSDLQSPIPRRPLLTDRSQDPDDPTRTESTRTQRLPGVTHERPPHEVRSPPAAPKGAPEIGRSAVRPAPDHHANPAPHLWKRGGSLLPVTLGCPPSLDQRAQGVLFVPAGTAAACGPPTGPRRTALEHLPSPGRPVLTESPGVGRRPHVTRDKGVSSHRVGCAAQVARV